MDIGMNLVKNLDQVVYNIRRKEKNISEHGYVEEEQNDIVNSISTFDKSEKKFTKKKYFSDSLGENLDISV